MYKNYIFDLYGTLIDIHTNENYKVLWDKLSLFYSFNGAKYSDAELKTNYLKCAKENADMIKDTDYPDFPIEKVFKSLYKNKGISPNEELVKDTAKLFRVLSLKYLKLYDGVIEFLEYLKNNNKNIYLLSNAQRVFTIYEMRILDIEKYFDDIFISSDNYVCKPDKKFYELLINKNDLNIKESIMIGNDPIADIYGAQSLGLDTFYIKSNQSPKTSLDKINADYKTDKFSKIKNILFENK